MVKSKIVQIFKKMNVQELNEFLKYVHSPIFNKHKKVIELCELILEQFPGVDTDKLERNRIQKLLEIEDKKYFNNISSLLLGLVHDFLGFNEYRQDVLQNKLDTIKAFRKKSLSKPLNIVLKQYKTLQDRFDYKGSYSYWHQYQYYKEKHLIFLQNASSRHDENLELQLKNDFFDLHYISSKLDFFCEMVSRGIIAQADYEFGYMAEISSYIDENRTHFEKYPTIIVYYSTLKMLSNLEDSSYYFELKELLEEHIDVLAPDQAKVILLHALNYCIQKINKGLSEYYQEFLSLYKMQLSSGILLNDGYIEEWDFKNIVTVAMRAGELEWTENFIHTNKRKLHPDIRENAYTYNLAMYYYFTQKYDNALEALYGVVFTDITYHLGAKLIQLQIFYEQDAENAFSSLLEAFNIYVKRNKKLSSYRKEVYYNFLKTARKIERLRAKKGFIDKTNFIKEKSTIETYIDDHEMANQKWIKQILAKL